MNIAKLLAALVVAFSVNAFASDTVKIMHTGGKTGTTAIIANEYANEFKKNFAKVETVGPGGCIPVLNALKSEKDPVLVLWDSGLLPTDECRPEFVKNPPVATFGVYFMLCTSAENNFTLSDFVRSNSRVALSTPFAFWDKWFQNVAAKTGTAYTPIPVGDSGKLVLSLISKETDWAMINGQRAYAQMQDKKLKCVASTNPLGESGLPFIGASIPNFDRGELILGFGTYVVNASTADRAKIESTLIALHKSAQFQTFLQNSKFVDHTASPDVAKKKFYNSMVTVMSGK